MNMILILLCLMSTLDGLMSAPDHLPETTRAELEFTLDLLSVITAESKLTKNVIFSPHSIYSNLLTMYVASHGKTEKLMPSFLRFDPYKIPNKTFIENLVLGSPHNHSEKYELTSVDRIYHTADIETKKDFEKKFKDKIAVFSKNDEINDWVSQQTKGMIKNLLKKGGNPAKQTAIFVNAAYFKGYWTNPFHHVEEKGPFTLPNGAKVDALMMSTSTNENTYFHIVEDEQLKAKIIALPYKGDNIFMVIILPQLESESERSSNRLAEVLAKLTWRKILKLSVKMGDQKKCNTEVKIPKFKSTEQYDLKEILKTIGGKKLFSGELDLSNAFEGDPIPMLEAKHKATVNVYEDGTEAAAATQVTMTKGGKECQFHADHSFVYAIYDVKNHFLHYAGIMIDPTLQKEP